MKTSKTPTAAAKAAADEKNGKRAHRAFAVLTAVAFAWLVPSVAASAAVMGSCYNFEDDPGFGGSTVECNLPCPQGAALLIAAYAQDPDAGVAGKYNCGGVAAGCMSPTFSCAGASKGLTSRADNATCYAESDEFWSSTVSVACAWVGGGLGDDDPKDIICRIYPDFPSCKHRTGAVMHEILGFCQAAEPRLAQLSSAQIVAMFPAAWEPHQVGAMRSLSYEPGYVVQSLSFVWHDDAPWECSLNTHNLETGK